MQQPLIKSFRNAFQGIVIMLQNERNAQIHSISAILVIIAGLLFKICPYEWATIAFAIGIVLTSEGLNSSIERLSDVVQPNNDDRIRVVQDFAAGDVLISAITAAIIGLIVFLPKLLNLLFQ